MTSQKHHKTPLNEEYPTCNECWASFNIISDSVNPDKITEKLNIKPTRQNKKGDLFVNVLNKSTQKVINGWFIESEGVIKSKDLRDHVDYVLDFLVPIKDKILEIQKWDDIKMTLTCSWWGFMHCGPTLWPVQLEKMSMLNIAIEIYFASYANDRDNN